MTPPPAPLTNARRLHLRLGWAALTALLVLAGLHEFGGPTHIAHIVFDTFLLTWVAAGLLPTAMDTVVQRSNRLYLMLAAAAFDGYLWHKYDHHGWWVTVLAVVGLLILSGILGRMTRPPVQPPGNVLVSDAGLRWLIGEYLRVSGQNPSVVAGIIAAQHPVTRIRPRTTS